MDQSHEAYHYLIRAGAGDDGGGAIVSLTIEDPRDGGWGLRRMDRKEMVNPCDPSDQADTGAARRNL
jgi:hypothetical protein